MGRTEPTLGVDHITKEHCRTANRAINGSTPTMPARRLLSGHSPMLLRRPLCREGLHLGV